MKAAPDNLVVLVGSGASESCNKSLTTEMLTRRVVLAGALVKSTVIYRIDHDKPERWEENVECWPLAQILWEALRGIHLKPNFETYVHALEVLEPLAASRRIANSFGFLDDYRPIVTAFMDVLTRYEPFFRAEIMQMERLSITRRIFEAIDPLIDQIEGNGWNADLDRLVKHLFHQYKADVLTLNYDDILDVLLPEHYDGFAIGNDNALVFSPSSFVEYSGLKALLLHLHGSVRYGYQTRNDGNPPSIVKYQTRSEAAESVIQAIETREAGRGAGAHGGVIRSNAPIISGFQKADKLMLTPAPFGYYFHAAVDKLLTCPRVLILGYGCRDPHLNTWIEEGAKIHGDAYRLVFVTKLSPNLRGPISTTEKDAMSGLLMRIDQTGRFWSDGLADVRYCGNRIMTVLSGMPLSADNIGEINTFLKS